MKKQPLPRPLTALDLALIAWSFYRGRHQYKDRSKAKTKGRSQGLAKRIKDHSKSGSYKSACRRHIRLARAAGFRGSFQQMVLARSAA